MAKKDDMTQKTAKKTDLVLATGRTIEQVQAEDFPLPFVLAEKETEIAAHFENIRRIRESAVREEIPEDRGIMLGLAEIFEHRKRFLEEKYWFHNGKEKDTRFSGYIRDRFGRADDETFYTESYTLARVAKFLTVYPVLKPLLSDDAILKFKKEQKKKTRKYEVANLMAKIRALSWKPDDVQQQFFDKEGELDVKKLQEITLEDIRDEGKESTTVPWKKFQYLPGVQHKTDGKNIVLNIKAADLRGIYEERIISQLDTKDVIKATAAFIEKYKAGKKKK
ncbi:MAG: hypothetical protein HN580_10645 [Deltaproteobacteria bacterium]|nr:hypothetical protein [Deltaproteobacteria bacterium]MBT7889473.1 hypothetical protein [Deltaproteobacteria bacterium]